MQAGPLRHRVSIEDKTEADDGHHGWTPTSVAVATRIPAAVETLTGVALERAQQIAPRTSHRVRLRYRTGIKSGQTVVYHHADGDRDLEIVGPPIEPDARRIELHLMCREAAS